MFDNFFSLFNAGNQPEILNFRPYCMAILYSDISDFIEHFIGVSFAAKQQIRPWLLSLILTGWTNFCWLVDWKVDEQLSAEFCLNEQTIYCLSPSVEQILGLDKMWPRPLTIKITSPLTRNLEFKRKSTWQSTRIYCDPLPK